jgi:Tol biopolymer transport system component
MTRQASLAATALVVAALACTGADTPATDSAATDRGASASATTPRIVPADSGESRFGEIRQLTFGGQNAEAYWSADGEWITFQSTRDGRTCDQQYVMRADGSDVHRISDGRGKTTCGWFLPGSDRLIFASSTAHDSTCPPRPDPSSGYVWPLDKFDIYTVNRDGSDTQRLTQYDTYTAEAVVSPDGRQIVFTSLKDGDLDIYVMNVDGTNVRRLTNTPGYDGGPWWSPDGKRIAYRANHPSDSTELRAYRDLLAQGLVRPSKVELFVMNADGSDNRQITSLGGANFGPSWTPDGRRIIFSSNYREPRSGNFDLYLVDADGSNLEQITTNPDFDGFPMFSPDGSKLMWASNRAGAVEGETNVFVAEWKDR